MNILFVHQNFPGQFRHLATALAQDKANHVVALCINPPGYATPGVEVARYQVRRGSTKDIFPLAADFETKSLRGSAAAGACLQLASYGFTPDLVVVHPGWGEHMFLREVFPKARFVLFLEFYYRAEGYDFGFDPEFSRPTLEGRMRLAAKNANLLSGFEMMDWGLTPTRWQKSSLPSAYQDRTSVIFDGIDTSFITPDASAAFALPDGRVVRAGDEVLTFVNRNLEPYRGFHIFMRALSAIQRARPEAVTLIVGGDDVSYGSKPRDGASWREVMMREVGDELDMRRIVFLGRIPYAHYRQLLRVSRAHAYLTYPFVLSWSMLEALAAECLVIGSATGPVLEIIKDGRNGLTNDFFDIGGWIEKIAHALARPGDFGPLRRQARADILAGYDLMTICLPQQLQLLARVGAM